MHVTPTRLWGFILPSGAGAVCGGGKGCLDSTASRGAGKEREIEARKWPCELEDDAKGKKEGFKLKVISSRVRKGVGAGGGVRY